MNRSSYDTGYFVRPIQQRIAPNAVVQGPTRGSVHLGKRSYGNDTAPGECIEKAGHSSTDCLELDGIQQEHPGNQSRPTKRSCSNWSVTRSKGNEQCSHQHEKSVLGKCQSSQTPGHLTEIISVQATAIQQLSKDLKGLMTEVAVLRARAGGQSNNIFEGFAFTQQQIGSRASDAYCGGKTVSSTFLQETQKFTPAPCVPSDGIETKNNAAYGKTALDGDDQLCCDPVNWKLSKSLHATLQHLIELTDRTLTQRAVLFKTASLNLQP